MRFRKPEWDIDMPQVLDLYWQAWNAGDLAAIRPLIDRCASENLEWVDPRDHFFGRDELQACMLRLKEPKPHYRFEIVSAIDSHHDRLRYRWNMVSRGRTLMDGTDIVTVDNTGMICCVEGFFGHPTPIS